MFGFCIDKHEMKQTVREDDGLGVRIACSASLRERLKKSSAKAQTEGRTKLTRLAKSATLVSDRSAKTCLFTSVSPSSGCRRNSVEDMLSWESFDEKQHSYLASLVEPNAEPEADLPILLVDLHNLGQGTQDNRGSDHENLSSERLNKAKHDLLVILASEKSEEVLETLFASGSCFHSTRNEVGSYLTSDIFNCWVVPHIGRTAQETSSIEGCEKGSHYRLSCADHLQRRSCLHSSEVGVLLQSTIRISKCHRASQASYGLLSYLAVEILNSRRDTPFRSVVVTV